MPLTINVGLSKLCGAPACRRGGQAHGVPPRRPETLLRPAETA